MKTIKELVLSAKNGNKKAFDKLYKLTSKMYGSLAFLCSKTKKTQKT